MSWHKRENVLVTGGQRSWPRCSTSFWTTRQCVALLARGHAGLAGARDDVERLGGRRLVLPTDVSDVSQVEAAADKAERQFGPLDVWINCAMVSVFSPARELRPEEYERVTSVTYLGACTAPWPPCGACCPADRGSIVQVGSALAYRGIPLQSAYCGAKHAIQGFTESVRM